MKKFKNLKPGDTVYRLHTFEYLNDIKTIHRVLYTSLPTDKLTVAVVTQTQSFIVIKLEQAPIELLIPINSSDYDSIVHRNGPFVFYTEDLPKDKIISEIIDTSFNFHLRETARWKNIKSELDKMHQ